MFDYSLLPSDIVTAIAVALFLSLAAFSFFVVVFAFSYFELKSFTKIHKNRKNLVCDVAYFHEKGRRPNQEDSIYISPLDQLDESGLVAACSDGMGGLLNGEVVSKFVTDSLTENFPYKFDDQEGNAKIVADISNKIYEEYHLSAGATLVMVQILGEYMNFYSLGDSNIILIRNNKATLLNYKQNYVTVIIGKCVDSGINTSEAYSDNRAKGLIDFVGNLNCNVLKTSTPIRLLENDIVIVCSDGVTDSMSLNRIVNSIHSDQSATGIARNIKYGVKSRKNPRQDNFSAVIIKMKRSFV